MAPVLSRREWLAGILPLLLFPRATAARAATTGTLADATRQETGYRLEVGVLFGLLSFEVAGRVVETVDRAAGRYLVRIDGEGSGVRLRLEADGLLRDGRYRPVRSRSWHLLRGRENRLAIDYDYERGRIEYHAVGHTFFLGRRRQVDDAVALPGAPVDDAVSACLNFAADRLDRGPDGAYRTRVVRRARPEHEGPDDVNPGGYRVEIVPLSFRVEEDAATGRLVAQVDMTRWSTWARSSRPAVLNFRPDRRIESVDSPLILGSRATLRFS
jgi:hypothetical protein